MSPALLGFGMLVIPQTLSGQSDGPPLITLGESAAPLNGPWKFQIGDSPIDPTTGKWLWAEPKFDDSKWENMDLTPQSGVSDPWNGDPRWVPGWRENGHPGYWGWAWYRLSIRLASNPNEQLLIDAPYASDQAWQLFANGKLIGSLGEFDSDGRVRKVLNGYPEMFPLPPADSSFMTTRSITLAFRVWTGHGIASPDPGGLHSAPLITTQAGVKALSHLDWEEAISEDGTNIITASLFLLLAVVAASLIAFDPADRVYGWLVGVLLVTSAVSTVDVVSSLTDVIDERIYQWIVIGVSPPLQLAGWVMVWWVWFQLQRPAWIPKAVLVLTVLYLVCGTFGPVGLVAYGLFPRSLALAAYKVSLGVRFAFLAALVVVACAGIRKSGREGWLTLPAILAMAVNQFWDELNLVIIWRPIGIPVLFSNVASFLAAVVLGLLMWRRLLQSTRRQREMAIDVKQAQEVQQVILPEAHNSFPGIEIESEYRPAREVGGDFFQIIPCNDGGVLIIAGDVTGKGLKAGMLVALLVGAIRSAADWSIEPLVILRALNQRLLGRKGAQATCLAMRIEKDGSVGLANAGHLAPYLNGEPIKMEGALPLGMIDAAEFSVMNFTLSENDRLVIISDGVIEATDANGDLFGFERVRQLLSTALSAAEVASAAQKFGQEDDISVISVTRTPVLSSALNEQRAESENKP